MNFKQEFLRLLQEGRSVDSIADEVSKALNAANIEYQRQLKEEKAKREDKKNATNNFIKSMYELLSCWDLGITREEFDEVIKSSDMLVDELDKALGNIQEETGNKIVNPIEEFLNKYVR